MCEYLVIYRPPTREASDIRGSALRLLRARTAAVHEQVESELDLLDPALSAARLGAVVAAFAGFWAVSEHHVDDWATTEPALAAELDWPRRRRAALLRRDAELLDTAPVAPDPAYRPATTAEVLGWLYVAEGSTLGGAVIARRLATRPDLPTGLNSFTPYAEGPGPMWQSFGAVLDVWARTDPARALEVADAGLAAFGALAESVTSVRSTTPSAQVAV